MDFIFEFLTSESFWCGFLGAIIYYLVIVDNSIKNNKHFSIRIYTYIAIFLIYGMGGGFLSYVYSLRSEISPIVALHIGASAPLFFGSLREKYKRQRQKKYKRQNF